MVIMDAVSSAKLLVMCQITKLIFYNTSFVQILPTGLGIEIYIFSAVTNQWNCFLICQIVLKVLILGILNENS